MSDEIRMTLLHHSTNDLIEELLMWRGLAAEHLDRIAELEAERRWIPVSERLPEKDGYYLVSDDHGDVLSCEFLTERRVEPLWDDDDGVLYWMPLPNPPEVE